MLRCRPLEDESNKKKIQNMQMQTSIENQACMSANIYFIEASSPSGSKVQYIIDGFRFLRRFFVCLLFLFGFFHIVCTFRNTIICTYSLVSSGFICVYEFHRAKEIALAEAIQYSIRVTESWSQQNQPFCLTCKKTSWVTTLKSNYIGFRTE